VEVLGSNEAVGRAPIGLERRRSLPGQFSLPHDEDPVICKREIDGPAPVSIEAFDIRNHRELTPTLVEDGDVPTARIGRRARARDEDSAAARGRRRHEREATRLREVPAGVRARATGGSRRGCP
jgi:hypothetical protein